MASLYHYDQFVSKMWIAYNKYHLLIKFLYVTLKWILYVWCIVIKTGGEISFFSVHRTAALLYWHVHLCSEDILWPLSSTHRKLAAISHGRSCYIASKRLLRLLCLGEDELKLQRRPEGSSKMVSFDRVLFLFEYSRSTCRCIVVHNSCHQ